MPLGDAITKQARKRYSFLSENDQKSDTVKERIRCSENRVQTNSVFKSKNESSEFRVRVQAIYHTFVLSSLHAVSLYVSMKSAFISKKIVIAGLITYLYKERAFTASTEYIHS